MYCELFAFFLLFGGLFQSIFFVMFGGLFQSIFFVMLPHKLARDTSLRFFNPYSHSAEMS